MRNRQARFVVVAMLGLACAAVAGAGAGHSKAPASKGTVKAESAAAQLTAQERQLRTSLSTTAAVVVRSENALELWYPVRLAFAPDGNELLPAGTALLDLIARSLREYANSEVVVAVYTDAIGSSEYNQGQSQARATVLVEELEARGVAAVRLVARGMGESAQLEAPNTPEGRDLNRRVQLVITPLSS
jgi:outer membrane protein OmpA-like peptidoglycan-associated protein